MADGSSGRPAGGAKKRKPGQPGHRQPAPKKRRPRDPEAAAAGSAVAEQDDATRQGDRRPWAMRRPLPPTYPGAKRPTPKPRTARDRIDTIRYLTIIGAVLSAVGVVGALAGVVMALGHTSAELPFGKKYAMPVEFILALIVAYLLYAAVNGVAWYALRRGKTYDALRITMFGGLGLLLLVVLGVVATFGQQGFLLAIAVAYALPYVLGPLILVVPVTAAVGYLALGLRRQYQPHSQAAATPAPTRQPIGQLEAKGNVEALVGRLASRQRAEREAAAAALARLGEPALPPLLRGLAQIGEPAAIALAMIGEPAVRPVARRAEKGEAQMLRPLVLLAAYGAPGATEALRRCADAHPDPKVREGAGAALQEIGSTKPAPGQSTTALTPAAVAAFRRLRATSVVEWDACPACGGQLADRQDHVVQCAGCSRCYSDPGYQPRLSPVPDWGLLTGEKEASPLWVFEPGRRDTRQAWLPMLPGLAVPGGSALDRVLMGERDFQVSEGNLEVAPDR